MINCKKNILITGGAGFIASHLAINFAKKYLNYNIIIIDKLLYNSSRKNLSYLLNCMVFNSFREYMFIRIN